MPLLEHYDTWATYCPSQKPSVTYSVDDTLSVVDSDPSDAEILPIDRCWEEVIVNTGTRLTLDSTNSPYYIKTLDLKNNSTSIIDVNPSPAGGTVELWVEKIVGDKLNGNQSINSTGRPVQFHLIYLGTDPLTLNGNADMNVGLVAPNAEVTVSGNFDYHGALLAKRLTLTGSGGIHYDESLGGTGDISDIQFRLREVAQYYR